MNYISQITFLRFLAAILVVIFHFGKESWPFDLNPASTFINEGSIAVSFFFFLSGVVLGLNYLNKPNFSIRKFYIKRFARLYPVYVLAFVTTLILGMFTMGAFPKVGSIILQLLSFHAWFPGLCLEINFPSWSISVEIFFYLLFPLILFLGKRIGNYKMTLLIISIWLLSGLQHYLFTEFLYEPNNNQRSQFILYFPVWHLNTFLAGILCAKYIAFEKEQNKTTLTQSRAFYIVGTVLFFVVLSTENPIKPYTHNGLMAPIFFLIIAGLSTDQSYLTRLLGNKFFMLLGNSSYSIYLFQWPVAIVVMTLFGTEKLKGAHFYIYLICLILFSLLIYQFYERKMQKSLLNRWMKNKSEPTNR